MGYDDSDLTYILQHRRTILHKQASEELAKFAYPIGHTLAFSGKLYTIEQQVSATGDASTYLVVENESKRKYVLKVFDPRTSLDRALTGDFWRLKHGTMPGRILPWSSEAEAWAQKWFTSSRAREFREWARLDRRWLRELLGKEEQVRRAAAEVLQTGSPMGSGSKKGSEKDSEVDPAVRRLNELEEEIIEMTQELRDTDWGTEASDLSWRVEAAIQDTCEAIFRTELLAYHRLADYQGTQIPRLHHHGQVELHQDRDRSYKPCALLLEYFEGAVPLSTLSPSKSRICNQLKQSIEKATRAIAEWCSVFGVLHNDLESDNFLLVENGTRVVMVDFSQAIIAAKPPRVYDSRGYLRPLAGKLFPDDFDDELEDASDDDDDDDEAADNEEEDDEEKEDDDDQEDSNDQKEEDDDDNEEEEDGEEEDGSNASDGADCSTVQQSRSPLAGHVDAQGRVSKRFYRRDSEVLTYYGLRNSSGFPEDWPSLVEDLQSRPRNERAGPLGTRYENARKEYDLIKAQIAATLHSCPALRRKKAKARQNRTRSMAAMFRRRCAIGELFYTLEGYHEEEHLREWYQKEFDAVYECLRRGETPPAVSMLEASKTMPASVPFIARDAIRALAEARLASTGEVSTAEGLVEPKPKAEDELTDDVYAIEEKPLSRGRWVQACWEMHNEAGIWSTLQALWGISRPSVSQWLVGLPDYPFKDADGLSEYRQLKQWRPFNALLDVRARIDRINTIPAAEDEFLVRVADFERQRTEREAGR